MHKFIDGPAQGIVLCCQRAPLFIRVVRSHVGFDALDQLDDTPESHEEVFVYVLYGKPGSVHYCGRDKNGKRFGRTEQTADYRLYDPSVLGPCPDQVCLRDNKLWREWCTVKRDELSVIMKSANATLTDANASNADSARSDGGIDRGNASTSARTATAANARPHRASSTTTSRPIGFAANTPS